MKWTLCGSPKPHKRLTATGEVQTNEEAQVYVYYLDLFVTVQLLEETPAVLSLGMRCSEHGRSHEVKSGETPRLTKMGRQLLVYWIILYLSLYQDCHHLPAAARSLHQDQRISQNLLVNPKHQQIQ